MTEEKELKLRQEFKIGDEMLVISISKDKMTAYLTVSQLNKPKPQEVLEAERQSDTPIKEEEKSQESSAIDESLAKEDKKLVEKALEEEEKIKEEKNQKIKSSRRMSYRDRYRR